MKSLWSLVMVGIWLIPAAAGQTAYERSRRRDPFVAPGCLDESKRACPARTSLTLPTKFVASVDLPHPPFGFSTTIRCQIVSIGRHKHTNDRSGTPD